MLPEEQSSEDTERTINRKPIYCTPTPIVAELAKHFQIELRSHTASRYVNMGEEWKLICGTTEETMHHTPDTLPSLYIRPFEYEIPTIETTKFIDHFKGLINITGRDQLFDIMRGLDDGGNLVDAKVIFETLCERPEIKPTPSNSSYYNTRLQNGMSIGKGITIFPSEPVYIAPTPDLRSLPDDAKILCLQSDLMWIPHKFRSRAKTVYYLDNGQIVEFCAVQNYASSIDTTLGTKRPCEEVDESTKLPKVE